MNPLEDLRAPIPVVDALQRHARLTAAAEAAEWRQEQQERDAARGRAEAMVATQVALQRAEVYAMGTTSQALAQRRQAEEEIRAARIAELEAELARLRGPAPAGVARTADSVDDLLRRARQAGEDARGVIARAERASRDAEISRLQRVCAEDRRRELSR